MLKIFSKIDVQEEKTHPCPPLKREGVNVSCAEHTVRDLLSNRLTILTTLKHKLDCFAYARNDDLCAEHTEKHLFTYLPIHLFTLIILEIDFEELIKIKDK